MVKTYEEKKLSVIISSYQLIKIKVQVFKVILATNERTLIKKIKKKFLFQVLNLYLKHVIYFKSRFLGKSNAQNID